MVMWLCSSTDGDRSKQEVVLKRGTWCHREDACGTAAS